MTIASFQFLAFALAVVLAYNIFPAASWRKAILLIANIAFLTTFSHSIAVFIPLVAFLVFGYVFLRLMQRPHSKAAYYAIVFITLLGFIWLKKYTFLPHASFLQFTYTTLGLSYIFFRVMHMIIDAHTEDLKVSVGPLSYLNYTLNFTTLISGPIQRYPDFIDQHLAPERPPLTLEDMGIGLERVVIGFFKVTVLSLLLNMLQNQAINSLSSKQALGARALTGAVIFATYPVYLYFNFSGYTDIVIGIARFLRIKLPENFTGPFLTDNFLEFWNHWHITLSQWLKTYIYNPLLIALMRRFPSRTIEPFLAVIAFFVTFFLIGVWHGRTSEMVFYGVLLGGGISLNKLYQIQMAKAMGKKRYKALSNNPVYQSICRGLNFTFFALSLLWFWSNWIDLGNMSHNLRPAALLLSWLIIFAGSTVVLEAWARIRAAALSLKWSGEPVLLSRYIRTAWDTGLVFVAVALVELLSAPAPDIVYKAF